MNKKKDDAGQVSVNLELAVNYFLINTNNEMTVRSLMEKLLPQASRNYRISVASHWKHGSPIYRPTKTQLNKIVRITGCPIEKFVKQIS